MKTKKVFKGDLIAEPGKVYDYEEVTGSISSGGGIKEGAFPVLQTNGGYIDSGGGIKEGAFPVLQTNGGYIYSGGGTIEKGAFPVLQTNGGYIYSGGGIKEGAFPDGVKRNDPEAARRCRALLLAAFQASGYSFADGILARIVRTRGQVSKVVIVGKTEESYLVTDGDSFSHGKTLKEARDGLLYKIGNRDTSEFKSWTPDKIVSKRDAIRAYRTITGACEGGVRAWLEQRKTPERIAVKSIFNLTEGAYGADQFKNFFVSGGK